MKRKVIAVGNVLMGDDGIAITVTQMIEPDLKQLGLEVIYGETDPYYCLSAIEEGDFLILLDAGCFGKKPGMLTLLAVEEAKATIGTLQHDIRIYDLLDVYSRSWSGVVMTIEIAELNFSNHISQQLLLIINEIAQTILTTVTEILNNI